MHKVTFAKGIGGTKEFWRMSTLHDLQKKGCFARLHLYEDNARFILLGLLLFVYLLLGACVFQALEHDNETSERQHYTTIYQNFTDMYCASTGSSEAGTINCTVLNDLLDLRGNMSVAGLMSSRPKWDFSGAFYFAATVISTLGFGMTIPRTVGGRWLLVAYGLLGCSSCILFFNLFLERIVTLLAYLLRWYRDWKTVLRARRSGQSVRTLLQASRRGEIDSTSVTESNFADPWKPSVYKVLGCLVLFTATLLCSAAGVYSWVEHWTYPQAVYFCFVAFATIGFGDFVPSQQLPVSVIYRIFNILTLIIGICCVYTLFNVFSIIIRQMLNKIIKSLDFKCNRCRCHRRRRRRRRYLGLGLRPPPPEETDIPSDSATESGDSSHELNNSGKIVSLKEFLEQNKAHMIMIQKQLIKTAREKEHEEEKEEATISASGVGPLAILTQKFGDES